MLIRLPIALLGLIITSNAAQVTQYPLSNSIPQPPVTPQSTTLIDALSADGNYTRLLTLLQRTRLVPTLNRLNHSTLFAPTNDAIQKHTFWSAASDETYPLQFADNIQEQLRQQLLYHLLNYSIAELPNSLQPVVYKTLHFPRVPIDSPNEPPPNPPWMPVPGGTLGGEPQRLRGALREGKSWLGTDYAGNGGVKIVRPIVDAGNGMLVGIGGILEPPGNLSHILLQHSSLSYFQKILPNSVKNELANSSELTLFLPQDSAWDGLNKIEKIYLESKFADDDVRKIINMHSVFKHRVQYSDTFKNAEKLKTANGNEITLHVSSNGTNISSAALLQSDIYASNGVLHIVSSLLMPGPLQLTPEKYLLALNCTSFVSLLRSVSLSGMVNTDDTSYTILAPRDDVITLSQLPPEGSDALKRLLMYHFLPGRWTPEKLTDGMLVNTALEEAGLNGGRQVLDISVTEKKLMFGGAGVIGEKPLEINNTIIYLITKPLVPPEDALQTALPSLQFSTFLAAVFSSSIANVLKTFQSVTLLIPQNPAFEQLGLVSKHLLSPTSKSDLEKMIKHHVITEVAYFSAIANGTRKTYPTLEGSDVRINRADNGSVYISPSGGWDKLQGELDSGNMLTKTGVIHGISGVLLPRSLEITIQKLAYAAQATTMVGLVTKASMGWVLNGTAPPAGSRWANERAAGWTLLCPTDASFKGVNMTLLWDDIPAMQKLVSQHLVPAPSNMPDGADINRPLVFENQATYSTLLSRSSFYGDITFRQADEKKLAGGYVVGIKDARGSDGLSESANVLSWGRSTQGEAGGVVQIDRLLVPYQPAWWVEYGPPLTLGAGVLVIMGGFFWFVVWVWRRETGEATYEPVGGFDREDDD